MDIIHDIPTGTSILSTVMDRGVRRILEGGGEHLPNAHPPSFPPSPRQSKYMYLYIQPKLFNSY